MKKRKIIEVIEGWWTPNLDCVEAITKFGLPHWHIPDVLREKVNDNKRKIRITVEALE